MARRGIVLSSFQGRVGEGACPGDIVSAPPLAAPGQVELPDIPERSRVGF